MLRIELDYDNDSLRKKAAQSRLLWEECRDILYDILKGEGMIGEFCMRPTRMTRWTHVPNPPIRMRPWI